MLWLWSYCWKSGYLVPSDLIYWSYIMHVSTCWHQSLLCENGEAFLLSPLTLLGDFLLAYLFNLLTEFLKPEGEGTIFNFLNITLNIYKILNYMGIDSQLPSFFYQMPSWDDSLNGVGSNTFSGSSGNERSVYTYFLT